MAEMGPLVKGLGVGWLVGLLFILCMYFYFFFKNGYLSTMYLSSRMLFSVHLALSAEPEGAAWRTPLGGNPLAIAVPDLTSTVANIGFYTWVCFHSSYMRLPNNVVKRL